MTFMAARCGHFARVVRRDGDCRRECSAAFWRPVRNVGACWGLKHLRRIAAARGRARKRQVIAAGCRNGERRGPVRVGS